VAAEWGVVIKRLGFVLALTTTWLILLYLVAKGALDRLSVSPWGNPKGEHLSTEIAGTGQVGQLFTAPYPGLYRIDVALDLATVTDSHQIAFQMKTDPASDEAVLSAELMSNSAGAGLPYTTEFAPLRDSEGQTYYFELGSPNSVDGHALAAYYDPDSALDGASAYIGGQLADGDLKFLTFYTLRTRDKFRLLLRRMSEGRPYLLGTGGFYIALALVYALVLCIFLWRTARTIFEDEGS
jgi:hypothetical protein